MRYQILVYQKHGEDHADSLELLRERHEACVANLAILAERGYLVNEIDLGSRREGLRIALHNDELVLESSEPSAEQEVLIRVLQIEAHDLNHALRIAIEMPELRFSRLELY